MIPKTILNTFALTVAEYAASSQLIQITWRLEGWVEQARVVQLQTQRKILAAYHSAVVTILKGEALAMRSSRISIKLIYGEMPFGS